MDPCSSLRKRIWNFIVVSDIFRLLLHSCPSSPCFGFCAKHSSIILPTVGEMLKQQLSAVRDATTDLNPVHLLQVAGFP